MEIKNNPYRILVIDDNPMIVKLVEGILVSQGYGVFTVTEAPQGLEVAMKEKFDLIVLDVMLPIINGFNMCRLLKSQAGLQATPIILLTSRTGEDDRKIGEEVGANAYLAKPFNTEQFLETVRELVGARAPQPQ